MAINLTMTVVRDDTCKAEPLDEALVVVSLASNAYLAFDDIGRRVWELLATPMRVDALTEQLANEFDGAQSAINTDVLSFLTELESAGVLNVVSASHA